MNAFDAGILHWLNEFAQQSPAFDLAMRFVSTANLLKGELIMMLFWWAWFARGERGDARERASRDRQVLLCTLFACIAAILVGRGLAHFLPFRVRPAYTPALSFVAPYGATNEALGMRLWSSFPSDHAMLFSALATGLLMISRPLGVAAYVYWVAVIGFPRIYLGMHYPTDVIGGAALGAGLAWLACQDAVRRPIVRWPLALLEARPALFYAAFFLFTAEVGSMFNDLRMLLSMVVTHLGLRGG